MTAHLDDDKLQQYFDGELAEPEMSEIRAKLEGAQASEEAAVLQRRLEALGELSELVKLAADAQADEQDLDADELFGNIKVGMQTGHSMRVIRGGAEQDSEAHRPALEGWRIAVPVVAVAIAAAVLFAILGPREDGPVANTPTPEPDPTVVIDDSETMVHLEAPHGTEVEEVDFGENTGTVFAVEGEAGEAIAVVWISDPEGDLESDPQEVTQ